MPAFWFDDSFLKIHARQIPQSSTLKNNFVLLATHRRVWFDIPPCLFPFSLSLFSVKHEFLIRSSSELGQGFGLLYIRRAKESQGPDKGQSKTPHTALHKGLGCNFISVTAATDQRPSFRGSRSLDTHHSVLGSGQDSRLLVLLCHRHDDSWAAVPGFYNAKNLQVSRLPSVFAPAASAVFYRCAVWERTRGIKLRSRSSAYTVLHSDTFPDMCKKHYGDHTVRGH